MEREVLFDFVRKASRMLDGLLCLVFDEKADCTFSERIELLLIMLVGSLLAILALLRRAERGEGLFERLRKDLDDLGDSFCVMLEQVFRVLEELHERRVLSSLSRLVPREKPLRSREAEFMSARKAAGKFEEVIDEIAYFRQKILGKLKELKEAGGVS